MFGVKRIKKNYLWKFYNILFSDSISDLSLHICYLLNIGNSCGHWRKLICPLLGRVCKQFDGVDGAKLFALSKEQLKSFCGNKEGSRLFSQITIQRNVSGVSVTSQGWVRRLSQGWVWRLRGECDVSGVSLTSQGSVLRLRGECDVCLRGKCDVSGVSLTSQVWVWRLRGALRFRGECDVSGVSPGIAFLSTAEIF